MELLGICDHYEESQQEGHYSTSVKDMLFHHRYYIQ